MLKLSHTSIYGDLNVSGETYLQGNTRTNNLGLLDTDGTHYLSINNGSNLAANVLLTVVATADTTLTLPTGTITMMDLETAQTVTGIKTFTNSTIKLLGSSTGYTTFTSANSSGTNYTLTFPAITDTLATLTGTETLTNKTLDDIKATGTATTADLWSEITTGSITIGTGLTTGTLNLDTTSTDTHTVNLATGTTASGKTKTVNIGTSGAASSTTNVVIGSANGGTTTIYSPSTVVNGNLTVSGSLIYIDVEDLRIEDKNIQLGNVAVPTDTTADGGGITLLGSTNKTITWDNANDNWTFNQAVNINSGLTYKINNVSMLSATGLGSTVVSSSLTSVGTLSSLTVSGATALNGTVALGDAAADVITLNGTLASATGIKIFDSDSTSYTYTISPGNIGVNTALTLPTTAGTFVITDQATGKVNLGSTTYVTGTLPVGNGGTGATTLTSTGVLVGNGTSAISAPGPTLTSTVFTFGGAGTINSTTTNALTLDSTTTGAINLGTNANAKTITIGNATGATSIVVNSGTNGVTFNQVAAGMFKVQASAPPTTDMMQITNSGQATVTAGVNALSVTYVGGAAAVEASAIRADITPGTTSGGIWNTFKVASTAAAASGVIMNVFKIDNKTTGDGTSNILYAGTGYDNIINYNGTTVINGTGNVIAGQLSGTIPSAVLGNSTVYIGTTGVALNRASGTLSLASIKLGSLTTNGPIYTSGSDGTLNSETYLSVARGGTGLGSITAGYIPFGSTASALSTDAGLFWDNTNKRLGVGTSSPTSPLTAIGAAPVDTAGAAGKWVAKFYDTTTMAANVGAGLLFQGKKATAGAVGNFAGIAGLKENATDSNEQGYLALYTTPSTGTITERVRVDSAGNMGVGETAPAEKLHINGNIRIDDSSGNDGFKVSYNNTSKTLDFAFVGA